jgi:hypothetical protein
VRIEPLDTVFSSGLIVPGPVDKWVWGVLIGRGSRITQIPYEVPGIEPGYPRWEVDV